MRAERIFLSPPWLGGEERARIEEALASNYIAPCGPMLDRFERAFAERVGTPHVCAVSSATAALDLLFHDLGVARGDAVFCSDLTFIASLAPAVRRGAEPVLIDGDAATWTMNPSLLEEALRDAAASGRLPKAVVAVDLYGQCCDYERIEAVCAAYGAPLIVDAAEALGAVYGGGQDVRNAGQAGWAAVYSFNGNKIVTTSGGGMVASRDAGVVERARMRAQQAREPVVWYEHRELGYNYRMSNILAAIGVGQLAMLDEIVARKRQIFEWYRARLDGVAGVRFMPEAPYGRCSRWLTVVDLGGCPGVEQKGRKGEGEASGGPSALVEKVRLALERENIEARPVWKPMHLQPVFEGARVYGGAGSARLFRDGLCLPSGAGLAESDVARVCEPLCAILQGAIQGT